MPARLSRRVFAGGLAASAALARSWPAFGAEPDTVGVGIANAISDTVIFVGIAKNYFHDEGLNVTTSTFASASDMVAPLGAGQLDVGGGSASAGLYNAFIRGLELKIVADKASSQPGYGVNDIVVVKSHVDEKRFTGLTDLKGMKVAISGVGTSSVITLNDALKSAGLQFKDVQVVYMSFPDQVIALRNKAVDAALLTEPFATFTISNGIAVKVTSDDKVVPGHDIAVLMYSQAFVTQRSAIAKRFMVAYLRAVRYYNDALKGGRFAGSTADDVISIVAASTPVKDEALLRTITPSGCDPNGAVSVASLNHDLQFYRELGLITGDISAERVVDNSFVAAARQQLGPYRRH